MTPAAINTGLTRLTRFLRIPFAAGPIFFSFLKKFCHYRVLRHFFFVAPGKDATKRKIY